MKSNSGNDAEPTEKAASSKDPAPDSLLPVQILFTKNPFQPPAAAAPVPEQKGAEIAAAEPVTEEEAAESVPFAWQPITFGGVAVFSTASLGRVFLVQLIVALIGGACVVWFVNTNYSPVIVDAIQLLPEETRMQLGHMEGVGSGLLADNKFLSLAVDLDQSDDIGQSADVQIELRESTFRVCSMFRSVWGVGEIGYPPASFSMSRSALEPWWGAWHPVFYVGILFVVVVLLMSIWFVLAWLYAFPVKLIAYYADRDLTFGGAWRLASAALMPGAITMVLGIVLYGWQIIDLIGLGAFVALHLVVGWIYILVSPCRTQQIIPDALKSNPFTPTSAS